MNEKASMVHRYKNTSYITVPADNSPSFVGNSERFQTYRQAGPIDDMKQCKVIPAAKAERIRKNQARIEASLQDEAKKKSLQEAARIESLSLQRQRYLDRLQKPETQIERIERTIGQKEPASRAVRNILTGLAE